jgi:RNA polymerase sigma factor (TIGR02999 family)
MEQQPAPLDQLTSALYDELRRLARQRLRGERSDHTLQTTALVHEAYLRLAGAHVAPHDRVHFLSLAATTMRRVLIDHARGRQRDKRGAGAIHVPLDTSADMAAAGRGNDIDVIDVDQALENLSRLDARKAKLLELHVFGGLTYAELAQATEISEATVHRELRLGRAWLKRALEDSGTRPPSPTQA